MIEFCASCRSLNDIELFHEAKINTVIFSLDFFSARPTGVFTFEEIAKGHTLTHHFNMKSAVVMTRFFTEEELYKAREAMMILKEIGIDMIYFTDCCLLWIAKELGMLSCMIYNPDTLITNASDAQFYLDQGIHSVTLSKEITKDEMVEIANKVKGNLEVIIHGRLNMMHSKRNLLSNYALFIKKDMHVMNNHDLYLMEENRDEHMPILEDELGTHVFTGFTLCGFKEIKELIASGIKHFRVECLFYEPEDVAQIVRDYRRVINNEIDGAVLYEEYQAMYPQFNYTNGYMEQKTSSVKVNL